jgi:hypothetical protein
MCTDETGSGNLVFSNSPSLVTPNLGTPSALALTNATGRASAPQTADKIATSATAVSISNAAPAAGQALIASSATTAAWQDLPAGGGPATALRFSDLDAAITGSSGANGFVLTKSGGGLVMASPGSGGGPATQLKTPSGVVLDIDELEDGGFLWLDGTTISTPGYGPDQMAFINDPRFGALVVRDEGIVDCLAADPPTIGQVPVATSATTFEWQDPASSGDIGVRITGTSFSASVDHSYLTTTASGVTVTLPDGTATSNRGKRLTITFSGDNNTVLTVGGASNSFAPPFTSELISLSSGTYEFRANYIAAFSFALWSVGYSDGTLARRSIDVDFCLEGNFPINYVRAPVGAGRWTLTATVDTPSMPVVDGGGTFSPGETVLAPFDANYPGLYRVNVMNAPTDWQVELIEAPLNRAHLLGDSETEYRIRYGEAYGSRAFLSNGSRAGDIPINYALQAAPCAPYPTGHYLGTEFEFGGHLSSELLVGRTNIIDASSGGPFSFTLLGPDPVSSGTADGSSTTSTLVDLTANFPDSLTGKTLVFVDGANVGVRATITSVVDANTLEFSAVPALVDPPGSGDAYAIVDLSLLVGSRFAIKLNPSGSSSPGVGINIPLGYLIEDPVLAVTDSGASLLLRTGAYVEWLLDWSGTWMVVGYHQGFSGG